MLIISDIVGTRVCSCLLVSVVASYTKSRTKTTKTKVVVVYVACIAVGRVTH